MVTLIRKAAVENTASDGPTSGFWETLRARVHELVHSPCMFPVALVLVYGWVLIEPTLEYVRVHEGKIDAVTTSILGVVFMIQKLWVEPRRRAES